MIIVDSHAHLDMLDALELDNIIARANEAGVKYIQTICTKLDNFENILNIAKKYPRVFASVGVHPSEVKAIISAKELETLSIDSKVIGIGETGLDYFYNKSEEDQELQRESFKEHIITAQNAKLPVIVHTRAAEDDTYNILKDGKKLQDFSGLIHCFTASMDFANKALDLGLYISISGIVTFKNAEELRKIVKYIPLDRIIVETDSPYLAPVPKRGKTNEPSYVKYVLEFIAELRGIKVEEFATKTTDNFFNLFTKAVR